MTRRYVCISQFLSPAHADLIIQCVLRRTARFTANLNTSGATRRYDQLQYSACSADLLTLGP